MTTSTFRALAACAALAAALLATPSPAEAAPRRRAAGHGGGGRGEMLSVWGVFDPGPFDGIGVGGRLMLPLAPRGILHSASVRDELTLELGADFVHYEDRVSFPAGPVPAINYSWNGVLPVVGATWNLWLTPRFALYPKVDLGWWFGWYSGWDDDSLVGRADFDGVFVQGAVGLILRLQSVSLRAEAGSGLLRLGLGFPF